MSSAGLGTALERAVLALEADDAAEAASEAERCRSLCDTCRAADAGLEPAEVASLRALLDRGLAAAQRKGVQLDRARGHVATSRRAHSAYGR